MEVELSKMLEVAVASLERSNELGTLGMERIVSGEVTDAVGLSTAVASSLSGVLSLGGRPLRAPSSLLTENETFETPLALFDTAFENVDGVVVCSPGENND